jgi:hypothetical protein
MTAGLCAAEAGKDENLAGGIGSSPDCFKDDPEFSNRLLEIRWKVVLDPWFKNQEQVFLETQPIIQPII